ETSFCLLVLLELRANKLRQKPTRDIWNSWAQTEASQNGMRQLNEQIINIWELFIDEYRTAAEIEHVLWTEFPSGASTRGLLVDLLSADLPSQLVCHEVVILSLINFWKYGPSQTSSTAGIGLRYDAVCTPRVLHALDLATHLSYFGLLVSYVLHPRYEPVISGLHYFGAREIILVVFSSSILVRPRTWFNIPFAITLLVFLVNIPLVPFAGSFSFDILLFSFALHAFMFHLPRPPSPLFVFRVRRTLPFAGFLARGFYHIVLPLALFFLPVFILSVYWLSMALSDTFFTSQSLTNISTHIPTPMETRTTVLFMFFTLLVLVSCSLFIFVVQGRGLDANASGWDAYSSPVGRDARATFARAVISYSAPYTFPAPFSLLQAIVIRGPSVVLVDWLRLKLPFAQAEKILWRICVGPVGLVFGLVMALFP
ncbi:hypothetical protein B0H15DRAFT_962315, partial [Mycena belliarum]